MATADRILHPQARETLLRHQVAVLVNLNGNPYYAVLLTAACLAYIVYPYISWQQAGAWFAGVLVCQLARRAYIRRLLNARVTPDPHRTIRMLTAFSLLNGVAVGIMSPLFFAELSDIARASATVILVGLVSGASAAAAAYLPIFIAYMLPVMLPLSLGWAMSGDSEHAMVSALVLLLVAVLLAMARQMQRPLIESFAIRFEREQLVEELERKQTELLAAKEKAEDAGHAKARVLAAASHDLRQPLHALSLYSAVLANKPNQETLSTVSQYIDTSVRSLNALLNALLDLSRLDAGVFQIRPSAFDVKEALGQVCNDFETAAERKGLRLTLRATSAIVFSDPVVFQRITRNLLDNAIKYTDHGSVNVSASIASDTVAIRISDSGRGIAKEEQARVFEEFYQLDNPGRDRSQGLGLGLSIVKRLTELLDTRIVLESTPGKGSVFIWHLPLDLRAMRSQPVVACIDTAGPMRGARILILDDEIAIRNGMSMLLTSWGARPYAAADASDAHRIMELLEGQVELIIADLRLQDSADGLQVVLDLQKKWGEKPVLLASGETDPVRLRETSASGLPLLHKPVSPETLRRQILDMLDLHAEGSRVDS